MCGLLAVVDDATVADGFSWHGEDFERLLAVGLAVDLDKNWRFTFRLIDLFAAPHSLFEGAAEIGADVGYGPARALARSAVVLVAQRLSDADTSDSGLEGAFERMNRRAMYLVDFLDFEDRARGYESFRQAKGLIERAAADNTVLLVAIA